MTSFATAIIVLFDMKYESELEIRTLLAQCGLVSKDPNLTHKQVREEVAKIIHNMPKPYKDSLLSLLSWMNFEVERGR